MCVVRQVAYEPVPKSLDGGQVIGAEYLQGYESPFYSGNVKDQNTQIFHHKHNLNATILARRCQTCQNGL